MEARKSWISAEVVSRDPFGSAPGSSTMNALPSASRSSTEAMRSTARWKFLCEFAIRLIWRRILCSVDCIVLSCCVLRTYVLTYFGMGVAAGGQQQQQERVLRRFVVGFRITTVPD